MYVCIISTLAHTKAAFADLSDGLVAYYPFNGNANDESGNGNNGTIYGATLTTDRFGNTNKAYSFDGTNDYVSIEPINLGNVIAFSFWLKTSASDNDSWPWAYFLIDRDIDIWGLNYDWSIGMGNGGKIQANIGSPSSDSTLRSNQEVNNQIWNHIGVVFDKSSGNRYIYINGTLSASDTINTNTFSNANIKIYLGASVADTSDHNYYNGQLDDIRIYNRALSSSEIQELYNEGSSTTPTPAPSPSPTQTPTLAPTPTPTPSGTGIVFGYVNDEDENPLRSVTVKINGDDYSDSATTDEDGYYEFDKVPAGDYTITYTKTGYVTQTAEATVADGDKIEIDTVVMPFVEKGSIYGYVVNIKGDPIESVRLTLKGIGIKVKKTASTDSDGFFEFKDLETGIYRIVAKKRFYKAAQQTVELEEGEDKEIEIEMKKTTKRIKMEGVLD